MTVREYIQHLETAALKAGDDTPVATRDHYDDLADPTVPFLMRAERPIDETGANFKVGDIIVFVG